MQTITFYSYNGGTGRTLAVANAAKYLVRLGQRVFAIDLDLEAPGLHYKLGLGAKATSPAINRGVVDYVNTFCTTKKIPDSLAEHTVQLRTEDDRDDAISLMPAGNVPCADYWHKLTQIDWHKLFYSEKPEGIPFFLELKARIQKEFSPDFLLIDSRTGITEIGGVATTVMPDRVVCLLLNNEQNLEGSRAVLRGIRQAPPLPGREPIEIIPVLSRLPRWRRQPAPEAEQQVLAKIKAFLSQEGQEASPTLNIPEVLVLHSEESLQYEESLRVGGPQSVDESPLLRDYLRLFSRLIPNEAVEPHLDKFIHATLQEMIERPDKVQIDLEALAEYRPHPKTYEALLKYYRMRNAGSEQMLRTASRLWELSRDSTNPLLWQAVKQHFRFQARERGREPYPVSADFLEAIWNAAGANDVKVGSQLANLYLSYRDERKAIDVLRRLVRNSESDQSAAVAAINLLLDAEQFDAAAEIIEQHQPSLASSTDFQAAWVRLIVTRNDAKSAKQLLETKDFRPAKLQAEHPMLYARLLKLAGQTEELNAALRNALEQVLASHASSHRGMSPELMEVGRLFFEVGKQDLFKERLKQILPKARAEQILEMFSFRV